MNTISRSFCAGFPRPCTKGVSTGATETIITLMTKRERVCEKYENVGYMVHDELVVVSAFSVSWRCHNTRRLRHHASLSISKTYRSTSDHRKCLRKAGARYHVLVAWAYIDSWSNKSRASATVPIYLDRHIAWAAADAESPTTRPIVYSGRYFILRAEQGDTVYFKNPRMFEVDDAIGDIQAQIADTQARPAKGGFSDTCIFTHGDLINKVVQTMSSPVAVGIASLGIPARPPPIPTHRFRIIERRGRYPDPDIVSRFFKIVGPNARHVNLTLRLQVPMQQPPTLEYMRVTTYSGVCIIIPTPTGAMSTIIAFLQALLSTNTTSDNICSHTYTVGWLQ